MGAEGGGGYRTLIQYCAVLSSIVQNRAVQCIAFHVSYGVCFSISVKVSRGEGLLQTRLPQNNVPNSNLLPVELHNNTNEVGNSLDSVGDNLKCR